MPGCQCSSMDLVTSTVTGGNVSAAALHRACFSFLEGSDFRAISSIDAELASTAADVDGWPGLAALAKTHITKQSCRQLLVRNVMYVGIRLNGGVGLRLWWMPSQLAWPQTLSLWHSRRWLQSYSAWRLRLQCVWGIKTQKLLSSQRYLLQFTATCSEKHQRNVLRLPLIVLLIPRLNDRLPSHPYQYL